LIVDEIKCLRLID